MGIAQSRSLCEVDWPALIVIATIPILILNVLPSLLRGRIASSGVKG
jgi:hypothetical protein